ncbi:hypothetical protein AWB66_00939 [Caballeronia telluris]|uniref:DUF4407 domain-containing protein n=2 Tax=Caballeronia telluris TaxID=326475 RepID=A0A158FJK4_9BURK|nr:hypothetical protein AWB66_00939 [Caballeronia telluris]
MQKTEFKEADPSCDAHAAGEPGTSTLLFGPFPPLKAPCTTALPLAIAATVTSLGIAMRAGYLYGSSPSEQLVCIAWSVAAVLCAHLLPALCRSMSLAIRSIAAVLWLISLAVVLTGQMSVFLLAQRSAGDHRADAIVAVVAPPAGASTGRSLTVIAQDQAKIQSSLAIIDSRHCAGRCGAVRARQAGLTAEFGALTAEADEAKRREAAEDRQVALADDLRRARDSLRDDPVTSLLAEWSGLDEAHLNLLLALVRAVALDGMASLTWYIAFKSRRTTATNASDSVVTPGAIDARGPCFRRTSLRRLLYPYTYVVRLFTVVHPTTLRKSGRNKRFTSARRLGPRRIFRSR